MRNTVLGRAVRYIFDILYGYGIIQIICGLLVVLGIYTWLVLLASIPV